MADKMYTNAMVYGDNILVREYEDGKHRIKKVPYQPNFYVRDKDESDTIYKSMEGFPLKKIPFKSISDAREYIKRYQDVGNMEIYGNTNYVYQFICDEYPGEIDFDISKLKVWTIDIETTVSGGGVNTQEANETITLITLQNNLTKQFVTFSLFDLDFEDIPKELGETNYNVELRKHSTEKELLQDFLVWWKYDYPTTITGWKSAVFDIPYIVNRIRNILGENKVKELSPFNKVREKWVKEKDKEILTYIIEGITHLDYVELYQKYTYGSQESYKLDYIAGMELGVKKLDMGLSFREIYSGTFIVDTMPSEDDHDYIKLGYIRTSIRRALLERNISADDIPVATPRKSKFPFSIDKIDTYLSQDDDTLLRFYAMLDGAIKFKVLSTFVFYNIRDVDLVDRLEDKMGLIALAYTIAYDAKCLPDDVFGTITPWDCMIYRFLLEKNIIIPQKKKVDSWKIAGAYVKEPIPGRYKWVVSFDAASLYPTIIMQYNMSPETLLELPMRNVTVEGLLNQEYDLSDLKDLNAGMCANGQLFSNKTEGLFPIIIAKQFADRKFYKNQMKASEAKMELLKAEMKKRGIYHD